MCIVLLAAKALQQMKKRLQLVVVLLLKTAVDAPVRQLGSVWIFLIIKDDDIFSVWAS